jgi:2-polyprenyl-3-methyl-5-hydroxy-6-metoxy-1,4-benzoquinol methylase
LRSALTEGYIRHRFGEDSSAIDLLLARAWKWLANNPEHIDASLRFSPKAPARILDYGCGNGSYLATMKALGNEVIGVDFDPKAVALAQTSGLEVLEPQAALERFPPNHFDAVSLSHVIEHVPDPIKLLSQIQIWLKPGGALYLEAPNADAAGLGIFGRFWRGLETPRHFAIPSLKSLKIATEKAGFRIEKAFHIKSLRPTIWSRSLDPTSAQQRKRFEIAMAKAPPETLENAEFLSVVAKKI